MDVGLKMKKSILIVNDDKGMLRMIFRQLRKDYQLYTAESTQQALKSLKNTELI